MTRDERTLTAKGARQAEAIIEAAIRCLGRDGFSATSLGSVAAEAGTQKRMVVYYFGTKHGLMTAVLERIGDRFFREVEEALGGAEDPVEMMDRSLDLLFQRLGADRAAQVAYFGLVAESVTDPQIAADLEALHARARALVHSLLDDLEAAGYTLTMDRELVVMAATAAGHGLGLELLQHGKTSQLELAMALVRAALPSLLFEEE